MGIIFLILICLGLGIVLIWSRKQAADQKVDYTYRIGDYSNKLVNTSANLEAQRQVNAELENDRAKQKEALNTLTNAFNEVSENLAKTETSLKTAQDGIAQRDTKISDLQNQNQALDQRAADLSDSITNLTAQIEDTKQKLTASEGDKAFLEKELQGLIAQKAELEKQFNDLTVLRAQVSKLKAELNISRRLDWIRRGLYNTAGKKTAELMVQPSPTMTTSTNPTPKQPAYDLNVEVNSDGTIKVIPPSTNSPAPNSPSAP